MEFGKMPYCNEILAKIKAVLFDLDDTLFDRVESQREAARIIAREFHDLFAGLDDERIVEAFLESDRVASQVFDAGNPVEATRTMRGKIFLGRLGLDEKYADDIIKLYVASYSSINTPVKSVESVINRLAGKFQLGVISNGSPDIQYRKLKNLGIKHLFDCIVLSEEIGIRKPDPRIFWRAIAALNKKPEECVYIGDSYSADVIGAKSAGMMVCWFNPDGLRPVHIYVEPDFEISALDEIIGIIQKE